MPHSFDVFDCDSQTSSCNARTSTHPTASWYTMQCCNKTNLHSEDNMSANAGIFSSFLNNPSTFAPAPLVNEVAKAKYYTDKVTYTGEGFLVSFVTHPDIPLDL